MTLRVGIPRAMGYYYLYPFFRTLLTELGAEPVLSPPTTTRIMERMDACPTDEPCLAVKLHFGHADVLAGREDVDCLFLPIIACVDSTFCCPKFIGIADMTRHGLRLPDSRVMAPILDYTANDRRMSVSLRPLAERLGIRKMSALRRAIRAGRKAQEDFQALCVRERLTTPEAYQVLEHGVRPDHTGIPVDGQRIAVIGHPYIVYEPVSQQMIERLRACGPVVTAEMVDPADCARQLATIKEGPRMWPFDAHLLGAALHLLRSGTIDKMILVGSFECGPESIIESYIDDEAQQQGIPLMILALDEHSGDAGLLTRLESFMDTEKSPDHAPAPLPTPHGPASRELVVGFPSMGHLDPVVHRFIESFGVRTIPTPKTTRTCVELGREIAPEFVCFPFTATLGQMRYMLDQGATALVMLGGKGYCRLGWYAQVQEKLLRNLGYDFRLITVDAPLPLREKWPAFREMMKTITGQASWPRILRELYLSYHRLLALDRADAVLNRLRAVERDPGGIDRLVRSYRRRVLAADSMETLRRLEEAFLQEAGAIETEDTDPLRVRIVGEIWVILEEEANMQVEHWLGTHAYPRVWVQREHSASTWFRSHVMREHTALQREAQIIEAALPWLSTKVGGHGQLSVGETALARQEGVDGILHILPFTCMPEIIAQNIMVRISEEYDLPILTYIVSEQTGEAGMETRLEAFLDILEERRLRNRPTPAGLLQPQWG